MSAAAPSSMDRSATVTAEPGPDRLVIGNARAVLSDRIRPNTAIWIENGTITGIGDGAARQTDARYIDARSRLVLPGFIDLHSDVLEKEIQPRPGAMLPVDMALVELDKKLAACGITTMYHCLCFTENSEKEVRAAHMVEAIMAAMDAVRGDLLIRNCIHARYEMMELSVLALLREMIESGRVQFFSIMDHTPGQGQFHSMEHFVAYYSKARKIDLQEVMAIAEKRRAVKQRFEDTHIRELVRRCRQLGIPMASHDDDSAEKVAWVQQLGIGTCEFPVNLAAAEAAVQRGLNVLMGAPNIMYGRSLTDNLSGREAIARGCCNLIGSDYSPNAMLHAVFLLRDLGIGDLPQMVGLVTGQPARVIGREHTTGSIAAGKDADLIIVDDSTAVPRVCRTFVRGRQVFSTDAP
jgi:alpha-D-ribose 1-methylphosphonate 5-triphosphate diphosphatase